MVQHCPDHEITMTTLKEIKDDVREIKNSLLGDMEKPGWLSRIRAVENKIGIFTRSAVAIGTMLGLQVASIIWGVLTHKITINW